jgi:hypothetical protein
MATILVVGIWSVNTTEQGRGSWLRKPLYRKLEFLSHALEQFRQIRAANNNIVTPPDGLVRAVFATPEYFFAEANSKGARSYLDGQWLNWLKVRIPAPGDVLLVPGSIAYKKELTDARREKYAGHVRAMDGHAPHEHLAGIERDAKKTAIHNVAYGFLRGTKVLKCRKQGSATDGFKDDDPETFIPGWATNKATLGVVSTAAARTLSFSIEICADASNQHGARTGYFDSANANPVNVKILVSAALASAHVYTGNYTDCLIHACSDDTHSGVSTKGNVAVARLGVDSAVPQVNGALKFYQVTVP